MRYYASQHLMSVYVNHKLLSLRVYLSKELISGAAPKAWAGRESYELWYGHRPFKLLLLLEKMAPRHF